MSRFDLLLFVSLLAVSSKFIMSQTVTYQLGFFVPLDTMCSDSVGLDIAAGGFHLAIEEINNQGLVSGVELNYTWTNVPDIKVGLTTMADHWDAGFDALIGTGCDCLHVARTATSLQFTNGGYGCEGEEPTDRSFFHFGGFFRTNPPMYLVTHAIIEVLDKFSWKLVSVVSSSGDSYYDQVTEALLERLDENGISVEHYKEFNSTYEPYEIPDDKMLCDIIREIRETTRIYIFIGEPLQLRKFSIDMKSLGVLNGENVIIAPSLDYKIHGTQDYNSVLSTGSDDNDMATEAMRSVLILRPKHHSLSDSDFDYFRDEVVERTKQYFYNDMSVDVEYTQRAFFAYDATLLAAKAVRNAWLTAGIDEEHGYNIVNDYVVNQKYTSRSGLDLTIDGNGQALANYDLLSFSLLESEHIDDVSLTAGEDRGMIPVADLTFQLTNSDYVVTYVSQRNIEWLGGAVPLDKPDCGFYGEKCRQTMYIAIGASLGGVILILLLALWYYRHRKYESDLDSLVWKIDWSDVQTRGDQTNSQGFSMKSMVLSTITVIGNEESPQIFATIGTWRGNLCAIKTVNKKQISLSIAVRTELKLMRDMHNDNITRFIGACVDSPHICIMMEYAPKGSLHDILVNDDMKLDDMFITSLIYDLVKGMTYLHSSPIHSHGNLKSSNCVVDNRFVLQITDYGLTEFKKGHMAEDHGEHAYYHNLLWRAPEHLHEDDQSMSPVGSQKGDVYSFSIILQEIYSRSEPYYLNEESHKDIIQRVIALTEPPMRPDLSEVNETAPECVLKTIRVCWSENPFNRPSFRSIKTLLRPLQIGLKRNILDNMVAIMERYTNNLEELVEERTEDVRKEKRKIETLLHRMLPPSIAVQLSKGERILPEKFEKVTIYFSDLVGFTALSAISTPIQIVNMLNDIYSMFDTIISNYDVYKVETIGDAYVLVSGLPVRNGNAHAGQIASAACHLLESIFTFKIRHRPGEMLQLRIGMHSGPIVAGVVGLTMPRYCLFGDTMNTSSRMESNGLPLKMHVSPQCREVLEELGGYTLQERGLITMKGKGEILTYWLISQDPSLKIET